MFPYCIAVDSSDYYGGYPEDLDNDTTSYGRSTDDFGETRTKYFNHSPFQGKNLPALNPAESHMYPNSFSTKAFTKIPRPSAGGDSWNPELNTEPIGTTEFDHQLQHSPNLNNKRAYPVSIY